MSKGLASRIKRTSQKLLEILVCWFIRWRWSWRGVFAFGRRWRHEASRNEFWGFFFWLLFFAVTSVFISHGNKDCIGEEEFAIRCRGFRLLCGKTEETGERTSHLSAAALSLATDRCKVFSFPYL